jgi:hypothetical protein
MREFLEMAALLTFVATVTGLLLAGVIEVAVRGRPGHQSPGAGSDDGDGALRAVDHGVTDRAEQHSLERPSAAGADDHQTCVA